MPRPQGNSTGEVTLLRNPNQLAFLEALEKKTPSGAWLNRWLALFAGRQGGKTRIGSVAAALKAMNQAFSIGWVCGPTYPDLADFIQPAVFSAIPELWIEDWSEQNKQLTLVNKAKIQFRSLDDPEKGRGPTLDWAWVDEACKVQKLSWDNLSATLVIKQGQAWVTTTPKMFDWVYRSFWEPAVEGMPGYWACRYRSIDNPVMDRAEIEHKRKVLDPKFFQQEYEADFVSFAGAVYDLEASILRTPDEIRTVLPEWPAVRAERETIVGLDPGADHPFAASLLVKTERGLVVLGEHLMRNKPTVEHARAISQMLARFNPSRPFVPDCFAIDRSAKYAANELRQFGIYARGAENSVVDGIRRVQSWLAAKQLWFVEPLCPQTVEQMRAYEWAEERSDGQMLREMVKKVRDDLPDALRYAVMTWPSLPERNLQPSGGLRALETFAPAQQWAVARNRRVEATLRGEDDDVPGLLGEDGGSTVGDFWGTDDGLVADGERHYLNEAES